jgi:tetratricopeptide (TPR) repeat protein
MGDFKSAIDQFNRSIAIKEKLKDQKGLNSTLFNLGEAQIYNSNYDDALPNFRRALSIANTLEDNYQMAWGYKGIGIIHFNFAVYDSAIYYLTKADNIYLDIPVKRLISLSWLALTTMKVDNKSRAQNYFQSFNELIEQHDPNSKDIISMNWNMYQAHQLAGDKKSAKEYLENSYLELKTRSKKMKNKNDRNKYLSVSLHQDISDAWDL